MVPVPYRVVDSLLTRPSLHRQDPRRPENLVRMECQERALAQHQRAEALPAILVLEDTGLRAPRRLVPILRGMDPVLPARAAGLGEHSDLEQCVRDRHWSCGGHSGLVAGSGHQPEAKRRIDRGQGS